jgi:hypothetical protein
MTWSSLGQYSSRTWLVEGSWSAMSRSPNLRRLLRRRQFQARHLEVQSVHLAARDGESLVCADCVRVMTEALDEHLATIDLADLDEAAELTSE